MENKSQKRYTAEIYSVVLDIIENWWVIFCVAVSVAFLAYIGTSLLYRPSYTSSTTFVVSAKESSMGAYANTSKTEKLTDTFKSVMDSHILKKKVAQSVGMEAFTGAVNIAVLPETNLLTVSVTSNSPEISFRLLRGMLEHYPEVSNNVLGEVVLEVFEDPNYPAYPDNPFNGRDIMKKAFLLGAFLMAVIFAVLSYMRDSVKSEEDAKDKLDAQIFAVIEHEKKYRNLKSMIKHKKKKILIKEPAVSFGFTETIKKMRTKVLYQCSKNMSKVIFVTSTGKQEGKTVIAANLALAIAERGKKVLLIEGDLRKSELAKFLGVEVPEGMGIDEEIGDLRRKIFSVNNSKLCVLVNNVARNRSSEYLSSDKFMYFVKEMKQRFDFVIIDGPVTKGRADAELWARVADTSLLVVRTNAARVPYINDSIDMLNAYGNGVLGCVVNDTYTAFSMISSGYGYGYGYGLNYRYGGKYGRYGAYGKYGKYGHYAELAQNENNEGEKDE